MKGFSLIFPFFTSIGWDEKSFRDFKLSTLRLNYYRKYLKSNKLCGILH